jgi:hypothetical protein
LIETYFAAPHVLDRMRSGLMAPYLGALATELQSQDYSRKSIRRQLRNADTFGCWLTEQNLTAAEITDDLVGRYIGDLHRSARPGYSKGYRPHNARGLPRLLDLLRGSSVLPPVVALEQPGSDPLQEFDRYLERVRGAARATRVGYLREVRGFVKHVFGGSDPHWAEIGPEHVASYITLRAAKLLITCRRDPITPMRAFLRYMSGEGLLSAHLLYAIPPIRQWKHAALPAALSPDELGKVLALPCGQEPSRPRHHTAAGSSRSARECFARALQPSAYEHRNPSVKGGRVRSGPQTDQLTRRLARPLCSRRR